MNVRSYTKRLLALLLSVMLVVGMLPTTVFATETGALVDAAIFCSDVHNNPSTVTTVFNGIKKADSTFDPTTAAFVGDTQCQASSVTTAAQQVYSDVECIYAFGNHDDENGNTSIPDFTGVSYGASHDKNYYIYTISENSMGSSNPDTTGFTQAVKEMDKSKPLFIISHLPLHARRNDSYGAPAWYEAISAAAEEMDIAFFWAHNHTSEQDVDRNAYYVEKDGSETITIEYANKTVVPNFTYLNAGYIDPPNTPKRNNVATGVRIYENAINYTVYNASGVLTGSYAVNETVDREFAKAAESVVTLESIKVEGQTEYTVGDAFIAPTVTAVYSDTTKNAVLTAEEYAVEGTYSMSEAGTYTLTYSYGEKSADFTFTVAAAPVTLESIAISGETEYTVGDKLALTVTATYSDTTTKDVTTEAEISGADMSVAGDYTVTAAYEGKTATYDITVAEAVDPEDESAWTALSLDVDSATVYTVGDELTFTKIVLTYYDANQKVCQKELSLDECDVVVKIAYGSEVETEYAMANANTYQAVVSYTLNGKTVSITETFDVCVAEDLTYADEDTGVVVSISSVVAGKITAVTSTNTNVATAMASVGAENYAAYDISPEFALKAGNYATVTMPIPEGGKNPVVYYVSDDGATVTNMNAVDNGDGTVSFVTNHFSTYVVTVTLPSGDNVTTGGNTAVVPDSDTVYTAEEVTVYKRVSAPVANGSYLIVSATNNNGLRSNQSGYDVATLDTDAASYYTSWNSSTNTGTAVSADDVYVTTSNAFLWTVGGSAGAYTFSNGSFMLGATTTTTSTGCGGSTTTPSLTFSGTTNNSTTWAYTGNILTTTYNGNAINLALSGSSWTASLSGSATVYFYEPVTLTKVTVSGGGDGGVYKATGTDKFNVVTSNGATITLASTLTWTPNSTGVETTVTDLTGITVTYEVVTDTADIIDDSISGSTATLTGNTGTATLKVSYTSGDLTAWDEFVITTKLPSGTTVVGKSDLILDKTVQLQADGTYTINLEAFATGESIQTEGETTAPADIVLVLDMSNSMKNTMTGGSTSSTTETRYYKVYQAVEEFVKNVYNKSMGANGIAGDEDDVAYRISIVTYNTNSTIQCGLKDITTNKSTLDTIVTNIGKGTYVSQGTRTDSGLGSAITVLNNYSGNDTVKDAEGVTRSKYVVLFTDGFPSTSGSTNFDTSYANTAITNAKTLKNTYGATVYAILNLEYTGAGPTGTTSTSTTSGSNGAQHVPRINMMMHAISSNYVKATSSTSGGWTVTLGDLNDAVKNSSGTLDADKSYYTATTDADELNGIFTTIANSVQNSSSTKITLDSKSVMKDIIGTEFSIPSTFSKENGNISFKVVAGQMDSTGAVTFPNDTDVSDISKNVDYDVVPVYETDSNGNAITDANGEKIIKQYDINVDGFDYAKYYIAHDKQNNDGQYKLMVTISGILVADDAVTDTVFFTNLDGSGIYAEGANTATKEFPQPRTVVTSKMYVLDYAKPATLDENDWYAKTVKLATAYSSTSNYGSWTDKTDGSVLTYTPKTTKWNGYDTATVVGEVTADFATANEGRFASAAATTTSTGTDANGDAIIYGEGANQQYVLSKVSVIPANNVYYEDDFITNASTGTVGIEYSDNFKTVVGTANNNTEVPEDKEDKTLGGVHGWIDSMDNDTTFSDGTAHIATEKGATATFQFTGTGVDVYSYTDMKVGMVTGKLYKVADADGVALDAPALTQVYMVDNLSVSGNYYQIPTLSFNELDYGTYQVKLIVNTAKAPKLNEDGTVMTEDVLDEDGKPTGEKAIVYSDTLRSTYYLDGIRVYNPLGATTNAYTGTNQKTEFVEIRDIILENGALDITQNDTTVESAMFIDLSSDGKTAKAMDYNKTEFYTYGPKNEVYLGAGQAIVFSVESAGDYYIGLKSPTGASTTAYLFGGNDYSVPFSHTTDQYYKIIPDTDGNICIYNGGSTMLSITKIQMVSPEATTFALRRMTPVEASDYALASVASIDEMEETIPEETVPEETVPDIKVEIENKVNEAKNVLRGFVNKLFGSMSNWFGR